MLIKEIKTGKEVELEIATWTGEYYIYQTNDYFETSDDEIEVKDIEYVLAQALDYINCRRDFIENEMNENSCVFIDGVPHYPEKGETLFEAEGIIVYTIGGKVIEADDSNVYELPNTAENREQLIADARDTIESWKK